MKQTAVEWLFLMLNNPNLDQKFNNKLFEKAKEMEKQQIIDAANLQRSDYRGMPTYNKSGEQYYNETFNK